MRVLNYMKVEAISGETPSDYAERLSTRLYELRKEKPKIDRVDITTCYLTYNIEEQIAESLKDEYELAGYNVKCGGCPFFSRELNRFGEPKGNSKRGYCKLNDEATLYTTDYPAHEKCYERFEQEGGIKWLKQIKN